MRKYIWALFFLLLIGIAGCQSPVLICEEIPSSENSLFTQDGRLFISSQQGIFEVKSNTDGGFESIVQLEDEHSRYLGMAEIDNYLYAICIKLKDGQSQKQCDLAELFNPDGAYSFLDCLRDALAEEELLLRAALFDEENSRVEALEFENVYTFTDMFIPNGMVADSSGRLYIADETFLPEGKIIRLTMTGEETLYEEWLTGIDSEGPAITPNGMTIIGDTVYFTNFVLSEFKTQVVAAVIDDDGSPAAVSILYERSGLTFFDDLTVTTIADKDYLVVADYLKGTILFVEAMTGEPAFETGNDTYFLTPTSVIIGKAPMFSPADVIVTKMFGAGLGLFEAPDL